MALVVGTGVVVAREPAEILLGLRAHGPWRGFWSLPGGKLEQDESVERCSARELREETGLEARVDPDLFSVSREIDPARGLDCLTFGSSLRRFRGEVLVTESGKFEEWRWVPLKALPAPLFRPTVSVLHAYWSWLDLRLDGKPPCDPIPGEFIHLLQEIRRR